MCVAHTHTILPMLDVVSQTIAMSTCPIPDSFANCIVVSSYFSALYCVLLQMQNIISTTINTRLLKILATEPDNRRRWSHVSHQMNSVWRTLDCLPRNCNMKVMQSRFFQLVSDSISSIFAIFYCQAFLVTFHPNGSHDVSLQKRVID